jgi:KaiC/GvpD/RAD55 family RecA-like ATPase
VVGSQVGPHLIKGSGVTDKDPRYLPDVFDFSRLFVACRSDELTAANVAEKRAYVGFPGGARILVTGEAGTGKTTFVLALIRSMIAAARADHYDPDAAAIATTLYGGGPRNGFDVYYLSTEVRYGRLQKIFAQFGWFGEQDRIFAGNFYVPAIPEDSIRLPMQGPQDLIDLVLQALRNEVAHRERARPAFVVVDTLTAMLKDSRDPGERRREAAEFMNRVEEAVGRRWLALMLLLAERSPSPEPVSYAEEVVADFVFRLGRRTTSGNRWQRALALTKCAGVNMTIGDHSWAVLGHDGIANVIGVRDLRKTLTLRAMAPDGAAHRSIGEKWEDKPNVGQPWATVAVFPVSSLPPIGQLKDQALGPPIGTGTEGLDEMLLNDESFWVESAIGSGARRTRNNALKSGTTTLVLGTAGTGKTTLCLQFLAHEGLSLPEAERKAQFGKTLYIDFENPRDRLRTLFPDVTALGAAKKAWDDFFESANIIYRHRANLDLNVLLAETRFVMKQHQVTRVVVDGLSDLLATTDTADYARLVETLLWTLRTAHKSERPVTTFVTFELQPQKVAMVDAGHLGVEGLSASADNVIVLRQLSINDELRRTIHILKARATSPDRKVREVVFDLTHGRDRPLAIGGGLETYTGLLNNRPEPVAILLQLFAENAKENRYNDELEQRLGRLFRYSVKLYGFSESSITRTYLDMISQTRRVPPSDIKVLSLDEWWIRDLSAKSKSAPNLQIPLLSLEPFLRPRVTDPRDAGRSSSRPVRTQAPFWVWEIVKATIFKKSDTDPGPARPAGGAGADGHVSGGDRRAEAAAAKPSLLAVPHYMDFGLFCVNTHVLQKVFEKAADWPRVLDQLPRRWVRKGDATVHPFGFQPPRPGKGERELLVDWMAAARDEKVQGFAFDSETAETIVCTFLEFCWNFGAREDFLEDNAGDLVQQKAAARDALHLLQYLVYHRLMLLRPSRKDLREALFTRHWYSTLAEANTTGELPGADSGPPPGGSNEIVTLLRSAGVEPPSIGSSVIMALPFMPLGKAEDGEVLRLAFRDLCKRLERLVYRMLAALVYRGGEPGDGDPRPRLLHDALDVIEDCIASPFDAADVVRRLRALRMAAGGLRTMALVEPVFGRGFQVGAASEAFQNYSHANVERGRRVRANVAAAMAINVRDILELLRWFQFRADMIESQVGLDPRSSHRPDQLHPAWGEWLSKLGLTGYCCAGSWMLGVERQTHSPDLSWKIIEEATSLDEARLRAETGAGMPARKDFLDSHGEKDVPYAEHLKWKDLLLFAGSRARRRDRIVRRDREIADIFAKIIDSVTHCLTVAAAAADRKHEGGKADVRRAMRTAELAVEDIFRMARV